MGDLTAMGNCESSLNCTVTGLPVESDPDISGIGVRIASLDEVRMLILIDGLPRL